MIIFTQKGCERFTNLFSGISGKFQIKNFKNGEINIRLSTKVKNKECVIIGTISPPAGNLLEFLMLAHTLKKDGAKKITAFIPYLAYARHDKNKKSESMAIELIGGILKSSGVDKLITVTIHSPKASQLMGIPVVSISLTKKFAKIIEAQSKREVTLIAPDKGALAEVESIRKLLGKRTHVAYFKKSRSETSVKLSNIKGRVIGDVFIIDDMIDTGGTLLLCAQKLSSLGFRNMKILITHGLFTGSKWKNIFKFGVDRIYCTDTITSAKRRKRITTILLKKATP